MLWVVLKPALLSSCCGEPYRILLVAAISLSSSACPTIVCMHPRRLISSACMGLRQQIDFIMEQTPAIEAAVFFWGLAAASSTESASISIVADLFHCRKAAARVGFFVCRSRVTFVINNIILYVGDNGESAQ